MSGCSCSCSNSILPSCLNCLCESSTPIVTCNTGYIFNYEELSIVTIEAGYPIPFNEPAITRGSISHNNLSAPEEIHIAETGLYEVNFYVNTEGISEIGILLSSSPATFPVTFSTIPTRLVYRKSVDGAVYGQALILVEEADSILYLILSSIDALHNITLTNAAVNASVMIEKVCDR